MAARTYREKKDRLILDLQQENKSLREKISFLEQDIWGLNEEKHLLSVKVRATKAQVKKAKKNCQKIKATNSTNISKLAILYEQTVRDLATIKDAVTPVTGN